MQIVIIINDAPYGTERTFHGLRLADALLKVEDDLDLTVYLTNDAVLAAKTGQKTPQGYYNIERMLRGIMRRGTVQACRTCLEARGIEAEELLEGVIVTTLGELATVTLEADKVLVF
ncbi:MAG: DsrE family protein [Deltaproteobacteria bacterium]|nr:DsrE family protein [Deltaproteobacteria bacterium]MBW2532855.1 DsrE family protein [Deltaproteobacteria bacterium]